MRSGRKEKQDPTERQKNDGDQVNGETPFTQTEAARQESLLHDSLSSHAADADNVRSQKSDAGQTEDDVESCAGANDDERNEDGEDHSYSASIERDVHTGSNL
jgi:hypothetical protein